MKSLAFWRWAWIPLALWAPNFIATWTESPAGMALFIHAVGLGAFFWLLWFALWSRVWLAMAVAAPASLAWPLELWVRTTQEKRGQIKIKLTHRQAPCVGPSKIYSDLVAWREPHILTD